MSHVDRLTDALTFEYDPANNVTIVNNVKHPSPLSTLVESGAVKGASAHFTFPPNLAQRCALSFEGKVDALPIELQSALDQQAAAPTVA